MAAAKKRVPIARYPAPKENDMSRIAPKYDPNTFKSGFTTLEQEQYAASKQRMLNQALLDGRNVNDIVRQHARQHVLDSIQLPDGYDYLTGDVNHRDFIATASTMTTLVKKENTPSPTPSFTPSFTPSPEVKIIPQKINHNLEDLVHEKETVKFNLFSFLKKKKK